MQEKQTASAPDWTKGTKKAPSEALRCGIPVPRPHSPPGLWAIPARSIPVGLKGRYDSFKNFLARSTCS